MATLNTIQSAWDAVHQLAGDKSAERPGWTGPGTYARRRYTPGGRYILRAEADRARARRIRRTTAHARVVIGAAIAAGEAYAAANPEGRPFLALTNTCCCVDRNGGLLVTGLRWWLGEAVEPEGVYPPVEACRAFAAGGSVADLAAALGVALPAGVR